METMDWAKPIIIYKLHYNKGGSMLYFYCCLTSSGVLNSHITHPEKIQGFRNVVLYIKISNVNHTTNVESDHNLVTSCNFQK